MDRNQPLRIELLDTTLRDGEQTQGVSFSAEEKAAIARALLVNLGVDRIEVASAGVSEGEREAVAAILDWARGEGLDGRIEVLGFVDHRRSVDWIASAGGRVINLLTKGSERHCRAQLGTDLDGHVAAIRRTVEYAQSRGLAVNVYLEDWSNGYRDSPDYVFALVERLADLGIGHFMLPDTLGVLAPWEVRASLADMIRRFPELHFDFHPHNDYGLALANVLAAVEAGIRSIHCTVNCLGERAGNVSLAEVAVALKDLLGAELAIDERAIVPVARMVENFSGKWIPANAPIVGADVFTQTAGIHADGDHKGGLYYSRLNPERFGRVRSYALGKLSGKASVIKNLEALGISLSPEQTRKVLERVVALGDAKHQVTADDLPFIIADVLESRDFSHIQLCDCTLTSCLGAPSRAEVELLIDGERHRASGEGSGGFDAFMRAVEAIFRELGVALPELSDYEVKIPRGGRSDALTECIITWREPSGRERKTRGVHANQVFAGVNAALRMLNLLLHESAQPRAEERVV
ncbi:MAG: 2-isopropylmalate synthase [Porticoccaceae bacterium]|nr:MAG: 2-isopropylmalate synthase [Porticoccaceae bacterium]